ncbi:MAG: YncE family protein [Chitinophagia bacterium]|jgi:DNA-binding beta-propeller fold protein YncE
MLSFKTTFAAVFIFFTFSNLSTHAQDLYAYDYKIELPNDGTSDYLSIDSINQNLYVTHLNNVHVISLEKKKLIYTISNMIGVKGVAIVNEVNKGFITDSKDNSVIVFNLLNFEKLSIIRLKGKKPSAIIFDVYSKKVFAFCTDSHSISVIDIDSLEEISTIHLPGEPEFAVADGKGLLFVNLEDKNSFAVLNTNTLQLVNSYAISPCKGPFALAFDFANRRLFSGCRENQGVSVINTENQQVVVTLPIGKGVGMVTYDITEKILIVANSDGTAQIFQQVTPDNYQLTQTLQTFEKARNFVLNTRNKNLYFSASQYQNNTIVTNSFALYVYKRILP